MSNLLRRVRKLETRLTDLCGLAPGSEEWHDYWANRIGGLLDGVGQRDTGRIPLEAIDAIVAASTAETARESLHS